MKFDPMTIALIRLFPKAQVPGIVVSMCRFIGYDPAQTIQPDRQPWRIHD